MLALHKLKVRALRALSEEREIDHSGCKNKIPLIAMLKVAEKEKDAQMVDEGNDDERQDGYDGQKSVTPTSNSMRSQIMKRLKRLR